MRQSVLALLLLSSTVAVAQERVSVVIELASPPAIESYLGATVAAKSSGASLRAAVTAAQNEIAGVDAEQQSVVARVDAVPSAVVLFTMQRIINGIAVDVDAAQLDAIRAIPGVKSVQPLPIVQRANTSSVPLIGGPDVWRAVAPNGATGKNVKVGLIDTGLERRHQPHAEARRRSDGLRRTRLARRRHHRRLRRDEGRRDVHGRLYRAIRSVAFLNRPRRRARGEDLSDPGLRLQRFDGSRAGGDGVGARSEQGRRLLRTHGRPQTSA